MSRLLPWPGVPAPRVELPKMTRLIEIRVPPPPTVLELIPRFMLTKRQHEQVYGGHDPGDEDSSMRRHARLQCAIQRGRRCTQEPGHFGDHDWQTDPIESAELEATSLASGNYGYEPGR